MSAGLIVLLLTTLFIMGGLCVAAKSATLTQRALARIGGSDPLIDVLAWLDRKVVSRPRANPR